MENLINYEFKPKMEYYFKYEVDIGTSKEQIIQVNYLNSYVDEKDNNKKLIIEENKETTLTSNKYEVGFYLRDLLNIYKFRLKNIFIDYGKILNESCKTERLKNGEIISVNLLRNLKEFLDDIIPNYSSLFSIEIINRLWYMEYHIPKYVSLLYENIEKFKNVNNFDDTCKNMISKFQEQINILESKNFFDEQCLKCINCVIKSMDNVIELVDKAFYIPIRSQKFKGINLRIPMHEVKYEKTKKLVKPKKYIFEFHTLEELASISIYMFDKVQPIRVINVCKNCGEYFIPDTNSTLYCNKVIKEDKQGNKITCKDIGKENKLDKNKVNIKTNIEIDNSNLYHRIYNRLKNDKLQYEFAEGYLNIHEKYRDNKEKLASELHNYLEKSDKKYRNNSKGKRGRPYKNS